MSEMSESTQQLRQVEDEFMRHCEEIYSQIDVQVRQQAMLSVYCLAKQKVMAQVQNATCKVYDMVWLHCYLQNNPIKRKMTYFHANRTA